MRRSFNLILFLSAVLFAAAACNDKKDDWPDYYSIGQVVKGTYPIVYTIAGLEGIEPATKFESTAAVTKGSVISAIMTMYPGTELEEVRSEPKPMLEIGLPLGGEAGEITFRNPMLDEDNKEIGQPYKTTVYIDGEIYENASVRIEGKFALYYGLLTATGPDHFISFTATVTPAWTEEVPDPTPIVITATDGRLQSSEE